MGGFIDASYRGSVSNKKKPGQAVTHFNRKSYDQNNNGSIQFLGHG
jgi:hypothetical protein